MKTWERYKQERIKRGREDLAREAMEFMDKQPPETRDEALYEFLSKARKNGNGKRE